MAALKGRSALTAAGMACGVFALVVMASMAEHFQRLASHVQGALAGRVYVCEKPTFWAGGGLLSEETAQRIAAHQGIQEAIPILVGRLQSRRLVILGIPQVLVGVPSAQAQRLWPDAPLQAGRWIQQEDKNGAVLGSDVAWSLQAQVGQTVHVLNKPFTVVGIISHTGSLADRQMLVPLPAAQDALAREGLLTTVILIPKSNPEQLAASLQPTLKGLEALPPSRLQDEIHSSLRVWRTLTLGAGLVAALTGSLCIVITMGVAVYERTYEIGLKKAIGASNGHILTEFLGRSTTLAALGWLAGTGMAWAFIAGWDASFRAEGMRLFDLTPRVLAATALTALLLGALAGSVPALAAARLDPIKALRRRP